MRSGTEGLHATYVLSLVAIQERRNGEVQRCTAMGTARVGVRDPRGVATLPVSGTLLAIVAAVGALLWMSQNLYIVRDAWAMFVNFAADSTQKVVDAVWGMVNDVIGAMDGLRQTANKLLPKNMEIKGKFKPMGESPVSAIAGDVRTTGRALGECGHIGSKGFRWFRRRQWRLQEATSRRTGWRGRYDRAWRLCPR